jgi:hypothetical protein
MKASFITLCLMLSLNINTSYAQTKTVWADPKHDEKGNLLPLQSCGETVNRAMKFILEGQATWAKGNKITDEDGKIRPPYFFHCVAIDGQLDGVGAPGGSIRRQVFLGSFTKRGRWSYADCPITRSHSMHAKVESRA